MTPPNSDSKLPPSDPAAPQDFQPQNDELRRLVYEKIATHQHDGRQAQRIDLNTDITGLFEVVSVAPSAIPKDLYDQVKIYVNGATYRLYWYDFVGHVWHYVTATA
jgi:hypothetical protein